MTFVYEGKGRKVTPGAPAEENACKKQACAIQWCLARRNYKENLCQAYIDEWNRCLDESRAARMMAPAADT